MLLLVKYLAWVLCNLNESTCVDPCTFLIGTEMRMRMHLLAMEIEAEIMQKLAIQKSG